MSQEQSQTQSAAQAGPSGEAAGVGSAVGGVHSRRAMSWKGESGNITLEHLAWLKARRRDSARSQACQRSEGQGDGSASAEIRTPEKVRKLSTRALSQSQSRTEISVPESLRRHHAPGLRAVADAHPCRM